MLDPCPSCAGVCDPPSPPVRCAGHGHWASRGDSRSAVGFRPGSCAAVRAGPGAPTTSGTVGRGGHGRGCAGACGASARGCSTPCGAPRSGASNSSCSCSPCRRPRPRGAA